MPIFSYTVIHTHGSALSIFHAVPGDRGVQQRHFGMSRADKHLCTNVAPAPMICILDLPLKTFGANLLQANT